MKNSILTILITLIIQFTAWPQSCLPEGITFTNQSQIDNFQINYPNCIEIEGDVEISGVDINSLNGLCVLNAFGSSLKIFECENLSNLTGLENVTTIGKDLVIYINTSLTSLTGLDNLVSVTRDLFLSYNKNLTSISSLSNLTSIGRRLFINELDALKELYGLNNVNFIGGSIYILRNDSLAAITQLNTIDSVYGELHIIGNDALINLSGLNNLSFISTELHISGNEALTSLNGLSNLSIIGGDLEIGTNYSLLNINDLSNISHIAGDLIVSKNSSITSLSGLNNIEPASIEDLDIHYNSSLSTCDVESICNYLVSPNGEVEIYGNAPGCNSIEEVQAACDTVSVQEIIFKDDFTISPNPCSGSVKIQFTIYDDDIAIFELFDISGVMIKRIMNEPKKPGTYNMEFNVSDLPAGVYIIKLQTKNKIDMKKIIKR